ncbi:MAG: mechanosensitive ion channel domain-containing protein [Planctomycetota bacterium]
MPPRWLILGLVLCFWVFGSAEFVGEAAGQTARPTETLEAEAEALEQALEQVNASAAAVEQVIAIGLASDEAATLLRESRKRLPETRELKERVAEREREVAEAKLEYVRRLEARRLADISDWAQRNQSVLEQRVYVAASEKALEAQRRLASAAARLSVQLDEELLWMTSASPVGGAWVQDVAEGGRWMADASVWTAIGRGVWWEALRSPVQTSLVAALIVALVLGRGRLRAKEAELAEKVGRFSSDGFLLTLAALVVAVLRALPGPAVLIVFGGLARSVGDPGARAVAAGCVAAGIVWLTLGFFRTICRPGGLADAHFHWDPQARRTLAGNLAWLIPVEIVATFFAASTRFAAEDLYFDGLGRLAFLTGTVALVVFVARVFRPSGGALSGVMNRDGWAWRLRRVWHLALMALPIGMTIAASVGYVYTAVVVQERYFISGVVVLMGLIVYSLAARWLLVARRRAAVRQARQRLAEQREAREREAGPDEPASGEAIPEIEPQTLDVDAATTQTRTLLRIGMTTAVFATLWAVWGDLLPALAVLERVELTGATLDDEGAVIVPAVTAWSLVLVAVLGALTYVAARNLPSVLELAVLERFPIDAGTRYAMVTLVRYAVIAVGVVWASRLLGIDWGRAQWIVAALGVGLGFGLQEIVANFVSGLIILFERPVRVGDVVTVGSISGTVSRLQIRATTITDWDNKEIIVPNKAFITDQVTNWTLSSSVTRLLIPVGIAYGSDVAKAHAVMAEAVRSVPAVLATPEPSVLFVGFGDSSLDFEVRAFVGQLGHRLPTLHELHAKLDAALGDAGIEIPFPQRDLHLRSGELFPVGDPPTPLTDRDGEAMTRPPASDAPG